MAINIDEYRSNKLKDTEFFAECTECGCNTFRMVCDTQMAFENNMQLYVARIQCAQCGESADYDYEDVLFTPE
jgi:predicted  nucleic acid-binding Zn-ribbon protein